ASLERRDGPAAAARRAAISTLDDSSARVGARARHGRHLRLGAHFGSAGRRIAKRDRRAHASCENPPNGGSLMQLVPLTDGHVEVGPPTLLGPVPTGFRLIVDILGGTFTGPRMSGTIMRS